MDDTEIRLRIEIELRDKIGRLQKALRWIADHSNDPSVVKRAQSELKQ